MKQMAFRSGSISIKNHQKIAHHRCGSIVLIPMVFLILSLAVIGVLLKQTSIEHKQLKKEHYQLQSLWLADAAAQRAVVKLGTQPDYDGEIWKLLPEEINGEFPGEVHIEIDRSQKDKNIVTIRIEASYPIKIAEKSQSHKGMADSA